MSGMNMSMALSMITSSYTNAIVSGLTDPMPGMYPTKDEILTEPRPFFRLGLFNTVTQWKLGYYSFASWRNQTDAEHLESLTALVKMICEVYNYPAPLMRLGDSDCYIPGEFEGGVIQLTKPSIMTTLHELAHHLFGPSEYHACRFSVWLYKLRFGSAYNKMTWHGHLLVSA